MARKKAARECASFTPLDPLVDTESQIVVNDSDAQGFVSLPSIHSWILKAGRAAIWLLSVICFTPLDPLVDTERRRRRRNVCRRAGFTPLDPLVDTERAAAFPGGGGCARRRFTPLDPLVDTERRYAGAIEGTR